MAYTTRTVVANTREPRGDRWRIVITHTGNAGEAARDKEYLYGDDEDLKRQVVAYETFLNGPTTVTTGAVGNPAPVAADPAGALRAALNTIYRIARLEELRTDLAARALTAGANTQAAGATITAGQVTSWNTLVTDITQQIDALKQSVSAQYAGASAGQKQAGLDNL